MLSQSAQLAQPILVDDDSTAEAVIDMSVLESFEEVQMEDEPDLIVELIDLYLGDAPYQMSLMQASIEEADALMLKRTAHCLKGSSSNLGARRVAALCEKLEHTGDDDSFRQAGLLLVRIEREYEHARHALLAEKQRRS